MHVQHRFIVRMAYRAPISPGATAAAAIAFAAGVDYHSISFTIYISVVYALVCRALCVLCIYFIIIIIIIFRFVPVEGV